MLQLLVGLVACMLVAASTHAQSIGFAQTGSESAWRKAYSQDVKAEAARRGLTLIFADANNDIERQREAVRGFIAAHVQAIVLAPLVVTGWTDILEQAKAANIPVFIGDRSVDADPSLFVARISADPNLQGRLAGAWLAQATRGTCIIVELQGTEGSGPAIQRHRGFLSIISQFPNMRILRSFGGHFTREGGQQAMAEAVAATDGMKDVCAVWSHNDDMLLGAIPVMREAGLSRGRRILTVSVDGVPDMYRAIQAGEADMTVEVRSDIGKFVFDVVQGYLSGRRDYPKWVVIPSDLHTAADVAALIAPAIT